MKSKIRDYSNLNEPLKNRRYLYLNPNGEPFYFISTSKKEALRQVAIHLNDADCLSGDQVKTVKKANKNHIILCPIINVKNKIRGFVVLNAKNVKMVDITDHVSLSSKLLAFLATKNEYVTFDEINESLREEESTLRSCLAFSLSLGEVKMGFTLSPEMYSELKITDRVTFNNLIHALEAIRCSRFSINDLHVLFVINKKNRGINEFR